MIQAFKKKGGEMKKLIFITAIITTIMVSSSAHALTFIDIDYTGNMVAKAHDTWLVANTWQNLGLGGDVGNQFIEYKAFEFTVGKTSRTNFLSIEATAIPYFSIYETARSEYISQRLAEGATPDEIGLEINGDANNPPTFAGPSQSIGVDFSLIDGSIPLRPGLNEGEVQPSSNVLANSSYVFNTDNSLYDEIFSTLFIPLSAKLKPNNNYWIAASTEFSGLTLNYSAEIANGKIKGEKIVNPEPSTMVLFSTGLFGAFIRKRKKR